MIHILRDSISLNVDAIIITETTEADELQNIIDEVKEKWNEDGCQDDLFDMVEDALPEDCEVHTAWASEFNALWY